MPPCRADRIPSGRNDDDERRRGHLCDFPNDRGSVIRFSSSAVQDEYVGTVLLGVQYLRPDAW